MPDPTHLTLKEVRELVHYDPETGIVTRLKDAGRAAYAGSVVGFPAGGGLNARVGGCKVRVHRLIWFYMTGEWPPNVIDHIDRDWTNNRWTNLRLATQAQNRCNSSKPRHNTSGHVGVLRCRKKWRAQITLDHKCVHIGVFDTKEEAIKARKDYANDMWGEFAPQEVCHR
jgi:hypothetical protein